MRRSPGTIAIAGLGLLLVASPGCDDTRDGARVSDTPKLSALVVLRPADGRDISGSERIASDNVAGYAPAPDAVREAQAFFEARGFDVFPPFALTFSIAGSQPLFEETFGQEIEVATSAGVIRSAAAEGGELEMRLDLLPDRISQVVQTVTFEPPPDFGPTSY